jgi:hypothetical protein
MQELDREKHARATAEKRAEKAETELATATSGLAEAQRELAEAQERARDAVARATTAETARAAAEAHAAEQGVLRASAQRTRTWIGVGFLVFAVCVLTLVVFGLMDKEDERDALIDMAILMASSIGFALVLYVLSLVGVPIEKAGDNPLVAGAILTPIFGTIFSHYFQYAARVVREVKEQQGSGWFGS